MVYFYWLEIKVYAVGVTAKVLTYITSVVKLVQIVNAWLGDKHIH